MVNHYQDSGSDEDDRAFHLITSTACSEPRRARRKPIQEIYSALFAAFLSELCG